MSLTAARKIAGQVDAVVFVEALVLDRHGRVLEVGGDFAPADRSAQFVGLDEAEARAVGGEHLRGALAEERVQRGERGRRLGDVQDVGDGGDHADDERGGEHAAADEEDPRAPAAAAAALSCLSRHLGSFEITVRAL